MPHLFPFLTLLFNPILFTCIRNFNPRLNFRLIQRLSAHTVLCWSRLAISPPFCLMSYTSMVTLVAGNRRTGVKSLWKRSKKGEKRSPLFVHLRDSPGRSFQKCIVAKKCIVAIPREIIVGEFARNHPAFYYNYQPPAFPCYDLNWHECTMGGGRRDGLNTLYDNPD